MGAWPCSKCGSMMFSFNLFAHDCTATDSTEPIPTPEVIEHTLNELRDVLPNHKHWWAWVWVNGAWTNRVRCSVCGVERDTHSTKQDTSQ